MMNERIHELAKKAGLINRKFMFGQYYEDELTDEQKKFAQSIVREVLAVQEQFIAEGHNAWHLNKPTKNHFGISE
jgi:hypothetical protein